MRRLVILVLVSLLPILPSPSLAQNISDELRRDIITLMESTGALKLGEQMAAAMSQQMAGALRAQKPDIPARAIEILQEVTMQHVSGFLNSPETMDAFVALYAKYYTHDEIRAITAFYQTPAGMKVISATPLLTAESMQLAQGRMASVIPRLQADLQQRLSQEGLSLE